MGKPYQGPYLYLKPAGKRCAATWIIRDRERQIYCHAASHEEDKARIAIDAYMQAHYPHGIVRVEKPVVFKPPPARRQVVYFLTCDHPNFPIKIGTANNIDYRVTVLQCALPFQIILLGWIDIDREFESHLHYEFRHLKIRGEWFQRDRSLLKFIQENASYLSAPTEWLLQNENVQERT